MTAERLVDVWAADVARRARYRVLRRSGSLPFEARMTVIDLLWLGRATTWTKERAA